VRLDEVHRAERRANEDRVDGAAKPAARELTVGDELAGVGQPRVGEHVETFEQAALGMRIELGTASSSIGASSARGCLRDALFALGGAPANAGVVDVDEHPRPDTTLEALEALRPVRADVDPGATVTAGNASGQNDGAAMCVVSTPEAAERHGLTPVLRLVSWAVAGVPPRTMGIGPVPATGAALARAELTLDDVDLVELNEAFAAQVLACLREWGPRAPGPDRLNVNGSGISLGHPVGATGARILVTMAHELHRRDGRYALETMCIGGGQGLAAVFEAVR